MTAQNEADVSDHVSLLFTDNGIDPVIDGKRLTIRDQTGVGGGYEIEYDGNYAIVHGFTEAATVVERWVEA